MTSALRLLASLLLATLVSTAATSALAQEGGDSRARELYLRGDRLYNEGRYEEAVNAFQESYRLSGRALLLFNLANAYERLGRYEEALDALRRYAPDAPVAEEAQIRARIDNLSRRAEETAAAEQPDGSTPPPDGTQAPPPDSRAEGRDGDDPGATPGGTGGDGVLIGVGAAVAGLGAALVVGGAVFGALALDAGAQLDGECADAGGASVCRESAASLLSDESTFAALADVGLFVGGAAMVGGLVLLIVGVTSSGDGGERAMARPTLRVSASGAEVGLAARF